MQDVDSTRLGVNKYVSSEKITTTIIIASVLDLRHVTRSVCEVVTENTWLCRLITQDKIFQWQCAPTTINESSLQR